MEDQRKQQREQESDKHFSNMLRWLTDEYRKAKNTRMFGTFGCSFEVKDGELIRRFQTREEALKG